MIDLRRIYETAPAAIVVLDAHDGRCIAVNNSFLSRARMPRALVTGRDLDDWPAFPAADAVIPDVTVLRILFERVRATGRFNERAVEEYRSRNADAPARRTRFRRVNAAPLRDGNGNIVAVVLRIEDVTDIVDATLHAPGSAAAVAAQQRAVSMLGQMALKETDVRKVHREAVNLVAETLGVEFCKLMQRLPERPVLRLIAGYGWEEGVVGHATVDVGPDSQAGFTMQTDQPVVVRDLPHDPRFNDPTLLLEHGVVSGVSVLVQGETGRWGVLGAHSTRERDFDQDDINFMQNVANVIAEATRRAQDIARLRERESRLAQQAALLDRTQDAITVSDLQGNISFWNKGAERLYGWKAKAALGRSKRELIEKDPRAFDASMRHVLENGEWSGELKQKRRDGSVFTVESRLSLMQRDDGTVSVLCINTDISERLALEAQLRQSQRLEAVGQLTGGIAHDFNNLLTVIIGNAELLVEQLPADTPPGKMALMTRKAAARGAELTHNLLAFARRQALDPRRVDVNRLVAGMHGLLHRALPESIDIDMPSNEALWGAFVDPAQLESVILNLSLNAKDAMPEGGRLVIEMANVHLDEEYAARNPEVVPGAYVQLAVSDSGEGIPAGIIDRVFDPFFTTKSQGKGSGLGLSMAYGFAKQSGGHIKIYSEQGVGTTVKLYLPRAELPEDVADAMAPLETGGSERILVVEDDDLVRSHAESQLEVFGYDVVSASSGAQALRILEREPDIDLLFTDVIMSGGMNGPELVGRARKLRPKLKVLYTSGYTENAIVHHGRLDEGVQLLQKPYHRQDLAKKVRAVLSLPDATRH